MQLEKEKLKETLLQAVLELQQRTGVKNVLLQGRIDVLKRQIEQQQLLLSNCICGVPEEQENKKLVVSMNQRLIVDMWFNLNCFHIATICEERCCYTRFEISGG